MRPALAAVMEQQKLIDELTEQNKQLRAISRYLYERDGQKTTQVKQLTRGLAAVAKLTNTESQVRTAIFKRADEQNPAQPIPDPAPEGPTETTVEAETPEAYADVRAPGLVPGTNNDTAADAVTTTYTPGGDLPSPAINQLVDVTRPIDGTQGPRPLSETKTLTDVRVGDPMNAQVAYPVNGPFSNAQRTSAMDGSARAMAGLRLAKLRISLGMSETGEEMVEMESIVRDASLSDESIQSEIKTLEHVRTASKKGGEVDAPRNLVPRSATVRTVPQMARAASVSSGDDEDLSVLLGEI